MKYIFQILFVLLLTCGTASYCFSEKPTVKNDTRKLVLKKFDARKIHAYQKDRDFVYEEQAIATESWVDRLLYKIYRFLIRIYPESRLGKSVYIILFVGFLLLIIFLFLRRGVPGLFYKSKKIDQGVSIGDELDASDGDIEKGIQAAIQRQDYRLAIRYLFTKSLKLLVAKELIKWQLNKTNRDYAYELKNESLRQSFCQLSDLFEYAWYGNFLVGVQVFETIYAEFNQFFNTFSLEEPIR